MGSGRCAAAGSYSGRIYRLGRKQDSGPVGMEKWQVIVGEETAVAPVFSG